MKKSLSIVALLMCFVLLFTACDPNAGNNSGNVVDGSSGGSSGSDTYDLSFETFKTLVSQNKAFPEDRSYAEMTDAEKESWSTGFLPYINSINCKDTETTFKFDMTDGFKMIGTGKGFVYVNSESVTDPMIYDLSNPADSLNTELNGMPGMDIAETLDTEYIISQSKDKKHWSFTLNADPGLLVTVKKINFVFDPGHYEDFPYIPWIAAYEADMQMNYDMHTESRCSYKVDKDITEKAKNDFILMHPEKIYQKANEQYMDNGAYCIEYIKSTPKGPIIENIVCQITTDGKYIIKLMTQIVDIPMPPVEGTI